MSKVINVMNGFILLLFFGVSMAFCTKDDLPNNSSNVIVTDLVTISGNALFWRQKEWAVIPVQV